MEPLQPQILRLPDALIDQIAAGEVVERPASVIKELVENALDAGARRIEIESDGGGLERLVVADDGYGMSPDDALLSLERHATSKLRSMDDLLRIGTLGFRGEALASIRSVSRFSLSTRRRGDEVGVQLTSDGGAEPVCKPVARTVGTTVTVSDLFYNVPARRKFLKGERTEAGWVAEMVQRFAMGFPEVHFIYRRDGKLVVEYAPVESLHDRLHAIFGRTVVRRMTAVHSGGVVAVEGFIGEPTLSKGNRTGQFTFINGRFTQERTVQQALQNGYGALLPAKRHPYAVLFVTLPGELVDVNVHPMKREVRFADPRSVFSAVYGAVAAVLASSPWLATMVDQPASFAGDRRVDYRPAGGASMPLVLPLSDISASRPATGNQLPGSDGFFQSLVYVGQVHRCFLICQSHSALHIIDQHAAHERVTFEKLRRQYLGRGVERQRLLFPITTGVTERELARVEEAAQQIERLGFELAPFGDTSLAIKALPALLGRADPEAVVRELLDELPALRESALLQRVESVLSRMACHQSIRGGDSVDPDQVRRLFRELDSVDFSGNCPHGRPVIITMTLAELHARFERS